MACRAVARTDCRHNRGHDAACASSGTMYMVAFGVVEVVLSQFPSLEKLTIISVVAAVMSCTYSFVGLFLSAAKLASNHGARGSLLGVKIAAGVSASTKTWHSLQALGNVAFAYTYSMLLIEIQVGVHPCARCSCYQLARTVCMSCIYRRSWLRRL